MLKVFSLIFITSFIYPFSMTSFAPSSSFKATINTDEISIKQTVDEDLKHFNIDIDKFKFDSRLVYEPIVISYLESSSKDYLDLIYIYDPLNSYQLTSTFFIMYDKEGNIRDNSDVDLKCYYSGSSSDGTIKRYAFDGYKDIRLDYSYRKYQLKFNYEDYTSNETKTISGLHEYAFSGNTTSYSNQVNVMIGNPQCWSWHFDEDSAGQNMWESFLKLFAYDSDQLVDQIFYSFYFENWSVKEIKSIDMEYKRVLLDGSRYNVASHGKYYDFFDVPNVDNSPTYYAWNESNSQGNYNKDVVLGHSLDEIRSKVEYTHATITPEEVVSEGALHSYKWNKIQNLKAFTSAFGTDSDIYKFASQYFTTDRDYWFINFDSFFYTYSNWRYPTNYNDTPFMQYLIDNKVAVVPDHSGGVDTSYRPYYKFTQEFVFDVSATSISFVDSQNVTYTLPTSVAKVDEINSGGESENPESPQDWFRMIFKMIQDLFNNLINLINSQAPWLKVLIYGTIILACSGLIAYIINTVITAIKK